MWLPASLLSCTCLPAFACHLKGLRCFPASAALRAKQNPAATPAFSPSYDNGLYRCKGFLAWGACTFTTREAKRLDKAVVLGEKLEAQVLAAVRPTAPGKREARAKQERKREWRRKRCSAVPSCALAAPLRSCVA